MAKKRVTLEEISEKIDISRTTLYKVINNKGKVSEKTRRKVFEAVEKYGYKPNRAAQNLALNREYFIEFIGFESPRSPHFLKNILNGVNAAERELHDFGLNINTRVFSIENPRSQIEQLKQLSGTKIDAVALIPNDTSSADRDIAAVQREVGRLREEGVVVITVNRDLPESSRNWYVGCDYEKSGALAAEMLGKMCSRGDILVPIGGDEYEYYDLHHRLKGFHRKIDQFEHLRILPSYHYNNEPEKLYSYLDTQLAKNPYITGLFDLTYELDVISAVVSKHSHTAKVIGFDLCDSIKQRMLEHSVDAIVFQDMFSQGYLAIKSLYTALTQGLMPETTGILTKLELVFEENLDFYI
ncbi:MAG: substrate-binding domain-containing protein [Spirochaetia bacterium]